MKKYILLIVSVALFLFSLFMTFILGNEATRTQNAYYALGFLSFLAMSVLSAIIVDMGRKYFIKHSKKIAQ